MQCLGKGVEGGLKCLLIDKKYYCNNIFSLVKNKKNKRLLYHLRRSTHCPKEFGCFILNIVQCTVTLNLKKDF